MPKDCDSQMMKLSKRIDILEKQNQLLLKLEIKLNSIKIQPGDIIIDAPNLCNGRDKREQSENIIFPEPFNKLPKINIGFSLIDAWGEDGWIRDHIMIENISELGF